MAAIVNEINPITFEIQTYSSQDVTAMSPEVINPVFDPSKGSYVEYTILSPDNSFQITDQNLENIIITNNDAGTGVVFNIDLDPERDLKNKGFINGEYNVIYKFLKNELSSSSDTRPYFIKEISPDRTELRLSSNIISNDDLITIVNSFNQQINSSDYFQDFYLNFGSNNLIIANNILLDNTKVKYEILINLYEPLPPQFKLKDVLWVVTQTANPLAFNIQYPPELVIPKIVTPTLKSPNFDLPIKNRTNNSTNYINYEQLLTTDNITSYNQILSYLEDKSISVSVDYTEFKNFVHFSSAESRIKNFFYKVQLLEQYNSTLEEISAANTPVTSSIIVLQNEISDIIKNFDGFEYYLYFESGSTTFPKKTSTLPYILMASDDDTSQIWYTSSVASASLFDESNKDYLYNTIPEYLRDDPQNEPYKVFIDMVGQYYDNIWVYYKDISNRYNGDNRLNYGISKDLVADAIKSFGLKIYQNNFSISDLFNAFTGFNSGSYLRTLSPPYPLPSGYDGELIETYQIASQQSLYTPLDDVNKEMYKRIYHNLPYLLKSKGTTSGLQNIISMFGITSSVLNVSEFGGNTTGVITGIQDIVDDNIQILTSTQMSQSFAPIWTSDPTNGYPSNGFNPIFVLSNQKSILQNYNSNILDPPAQLRTLSPSVNTVEITFSPQNDIDNYIKSNGNFDIGAYIGNPSQMFLPYYPDLYSRADTLLSTNNELKATTYIRLIKYFDNSLFNMIKDFVPARTNLKSGITIKPHILNRSKYVQPQAFITSSIHSGLIDTAFIEGGTGGTFDVYNSLTPRFNNTQSWSETIITPLGPTQSLHIDQAEFYNGELPYYPTIATNGELNPENPFKFSPAPSLSETPLYTVLYTYSDDQSLSDFVNNVIPSSGTIRVWVRKQIIPTPTDEYGVYNRTTVLTIEYLKIHPVSNNGINSSEVLYTLDSLTLPYYFGTGYYWVNVNVGNSYVDDGGIYNYDLSSRGSATTLPTATEAFPSMGYIAFFPTLESKLIIWDYNTNNPIVNNSALDVTSVHYMKADLDDGILTPSNFELLISLSASRASVQDSNYYSKAWSNIRYNGSRQSSIDFNKPY